MPAILVFTTETERTTSPQRHRDHGGFDVFNIRWLNPNHGQTRSLRWRKKFMNVESFKPFSVSSVVKSSLRLGELRRRLREPGDHIGARFDVLLDADSIVRLNVFEQIAERAVAVVFLVARQLLALHGLLD